MTITVGELRVYPVKSTAGYSVSEIEYGRDGLKGDRQLVIVSNKGKFITAREKPALLTLKSRWVSDTIVELSAHDSSHLISLSRHSQTTQEVGIWADTVTSTDLGNQAAGWISSFLGTPARIMTVAAGGERTSARAPLAPRSYADAYPLLLLSAASVSDINSRLSEPVTTVSFRPNIILDGVQEGFAEDLWATIKIGDVELDLILGCHRCVMTTVDPITGIKRTDGEPMKSLGKYRRGTDKKIYVGQNTVPRKNGIIKVGDPVEIISTRPQNIYSCDL